MAKRWTQKSFDQCRSEQLAVLRVVCHEDRLSFIEDRLNDFQSSTNSDYMAHLIWILFYLRHLGKLGRPKNVKAVRDLAFGILRLQNIQKSTSTLSYIYGHIHILISQIYLRYGDRWKAAWEQQMALHSSLGQLPHGCAFQTHSMAVRAFNLGQIQLAQEMYAAAEQIGLDEHHRFQAKISRAICLRLFGSYDEACLLLEEAGAFAKGRGQSLELLWESALLSAMKDQDLDPLMALVGRGKSHDKGSYLVEAYLWAFAWPNKKAISELCLVRTVLRHKDLDFHGVEKVMKFNRILEEAYDTRIPFNKRLSKLGDQLGTIEGFNTATIKLLAWAAATRWLVRSHAKDLAKLTFGEYRKMSLGLTEGQSYDCLNLFQDSGLLGSSGQGPIQGEEQANLSASGA